MNSRHLTLCGGDEWAATVREHIIPWVLDGIELGDDVIEVGPGPGRTTEVLCTMVPALTAVELDRSLAHKLGQRLRRPGLSVINGDATVLPLRDGRYSTALTFTMLHHVPTPELQDRVLAELARVLRPGGIAAGVDSLDSPEFRELHADDICVPLDPETLHARLLGAGFDSAEVRTSTRRIRFRARKAS